MISSQTEYTKKLAFLLQTQTNRSQLKFSKDLRARSIKKDKTLSISANKTIGQRTTPLDTSQTAKNISALTFTKPPSKLPRNISNQENQDIKLGETKELVFQKGYKLKLKQKKTNTAFNFQSPNDITNVSSVQINSCTNLTNIINHKNYPKTQRKTSTNRESNDLQSSFRIQKAKKIVKKPIETITSPLKISDFQLGQCIGSGKFGDVHICLHKKTQLLFAIKKILKSTILQYSMLTQFINQLKIQYILDHQNIVKLYSHFDDEYHIFLLMEYAPGGTLMKHINNSESYTAGMLEQILDAVKYTHQHHIIHRDIKPENIVLFFGNTYKLCDFGLAAYLSSYQDARTSFCGTLDYIAPEMKEIGLYNYSVDIWGLGVLCYEVLFGKAPFKQQISNWKKRGGKRHSNWNWKISYPSYTSASAVKFMSNLLKQNPNERVSLYSALQSEFIRNRRELPSALLAAEQQFLKNDHS